jgi:enterochelin esterase family protein
MTYKKYEIPKHLTEQALAFDPVLPPEGVPDPIVTDENGQLFLQVYAPDAKRVFFDMEEKIYECERGEDGIWRTPYPFTGGYHYVLLNIDGATVLSPWLPIGYGYSRPSNFVATPEKDADWYDLRDVPHGRLFRDYFFSEVTGEMQSCTVYLPKACEENPNTVFPVLYLQHGHGENEIGWGTAGKLPFILDNLIADGKCVPFAVVMNNGMVQKKEGGERVVEFRQFDDYLMKDVIPHIESSYPLGGQKKLRAMAGLSMGSLQTSISGMTHPEMFSSLGVFSGFMYDCLRNLEEDEARGAKINAHMALLEDPERFDREFDVFFRAIGDRDPFLDRFLDDDERCNRAGIRQIRKIYSGSHDWNVWRECIRDFAMLIFQKNS